MNEVVLAADLGGTNIRMAAVDSDGGYSEVVKRETPRDVSPQQLISLVKTMADECQPTSTVVKAVGFAVPAPVSADCSRSCRCRPGDCRR